MSSPMEIYLAEIPYEDRNQVKQSYVDIHRTFTLPQRIVFKKPPLGKLTTIDTIGLFEFIKKS